MNTRVHRLSPTGGSRPAVLLTIEPLEERRAPAAFVVTSALDPTEIGKMTLRDAIIASNATPGPNTITFNISPGGEQTINLASPLPALTQPVEIYGGSQNDTTFQEPAIILNGSGAGAGDGFDVMAGNSTIEGFVIEYFSGHGVVLSAKGHDEVINDCIGTNAQHNGADPNTMNGVLINNVANNAVQSCIISGNKMNGIEVTGMNAMNNLLGSGLTASANVGTDEGYGNYIGTDYYATGAIANELDGILIHNAASNTTITDNVISGNLGNGIHITGTGTAAAGTGTTGTYIYGNAIGVDYSKTASLANGLDGVLIDNGANDTTIGDGTSPNANVISSNGGFGVHLVGTGAVPAGMGTTGNTVAGDFIGTDISGTIALGNTKDGVRIEGGANNNTIGAASSHNIISDNAGNGISISGTGAVKSGMGTTGNSVIGNYIGTDITGKLDLGNRLEGIVIDNGANLNKIGDGTTQNANVISANSGDGVYINGSSLTVPNGMVGTWQNSVLGNMIGTDVTGKNALGNDLDGVLLDSGAQMNTVGGPHMMNLISGNGLNGIEIGGMTSSGNIVQGNYIGTDITGKMALGNESDGIFIDGAPGNFIGGDNMETKMLYNGNLVSGNAGNGIHITGATAMGNLVRGNFIGTAVNSQSALANTGNGVLIDGAPGNTIGNQLSETGKDYRNVISGNSANGVLIVNGANGNFVVGDFIGADISGEMSVGNAGNGVSIADSSNTTISNVSTVLGCVISGNQLNGVLITGAASTGTKVLNSKIGTDGKGNIGIANILDGIAINDGSAGNFTGDTISGNQGNGVSITGANATENVFANDNIGTNVDNSAALGNTEDGILINGGASSNMVGDGVSSNTIAGNGGNGVEIGGLLTNTNVVQKNYIGTNGKVAFPNQDGVLINNGASNNTIGGVTAKAGTGPGNVISGNAVNGIEIDGTLTDINIVEGNVIGTDPSGTVAMGNTNDGILIRDFPDGLLFMGSKGSMG